MTGKRILDVDVLRFVHRKGEVNAWDVAYRFGIGYNKSRTKLVRLQKGGFLKRTHNKGGWKIDTDF